jgi:hypothetical protein
LVGNEAINEYHQFANELMLRKKNALEEKLSGKAQEKSEENQQRISELETQLQDKYGMVPGLTYHAATDAGMVSKIVSKRAMEKAISSGKVKREHTRQLEITRDDKQETAYTLPHMRISDTKAVQKFQGGLNKWQELKAKIEQARKKGDSIARFSLEEQFEAYSKDMKENFNVVPEDNYVFDTLSVAVYAVISEEHLQMIAGIQQREREMHLRAAWEKSQKDS